jgi:hypothetical protein
MLLLAFAITVCALVSDVHVHAVLCKLSALSSVKAEVQLLLLLLGGRVDELSSKKRPCGGS